MPRPLERLVLALAQVFPAFAIAQTAYSTVTAPTEAVETVVITATKSAQPLAQTANSVTVLESEAVEARRIRTLVDLPAAVPNLQLDNSLGAGTLGYLTIRGLGNGPGSWDPAATIFIDDVPFNDFFGYTASLIDVDRIEVLRGPQGTLYGGFAEAGVIDIRSRLPGLSFGGFGALEVSSRSTLRASASLSAPLAGRAFRLGVAALAEQRNGPVRNVATGDSPKHRAVDLIARLRTPEYAQAVQLYLEYDPAPRFNAGSRRCRSPCTIRTKFATVRATPTYPGEDS